MQNGVGGVHQHAAAPMVEHCVKDVLFLDDSYLPHHIDGGLHVRHRP